MTVMEQEIADYVARVRAALADLPPARRDELTEDLPDHLAEVAAEAEGSLVDRLGEPEAYAAELRAAAGAPPSGRNLDQRVAAAVVRVRGRLRALDTRLGPPLGYATASDFLRLLRPGWWVLRGYLAAMLVTVMSTGGTFGLLPRFGGELIAGLVMLVAFVLASIWLGRRSANLSRWPRSAMQVASAALVVFALAAVVNAEDRAGYLNRDPYGYDQMSVDNPYDRVRDVFVYDSEGRLVENARLFDQNGDPIRLGYPDCSPYGVDDKPLLRPYPYCPNQAPFGVPGVPAPAPATPSAGVTATPRPTATATAPATMDPTGTPSGAPRPTATG
ncbi:hypothetical protein ACFOW4_21725 [Micromonospora sp. GCM10011542]|uniref:HAAS signaling domain-containing protein n=1 Tax=Micromonospora sp. GCM10011542 TaxID=3317337 RepID=UPI00360F2B8D